MLNKNILTYTQMMEELKNKVTTCRTEIETLKEEKIDVMFDYGVDGEEYDEWIAEQHLEIQRLHRMITNLEEIYKEVR